MLIDTNMARNQRFSQLVSPFSEWHRNQHDGINYFDLDMVGTCPACAAPLFLADTIYNLDFRFKGKSDWHRTPYKILAEAADIPYYEFFYTVEESNKRRDIIRFDINRIRPYSGKVWRNLSPDQMLQFLEYMALKSHGPNCTNKDYLIRKITNNKCGNKFIRQQNYVNFLSI